jgi:hypothetical protein
MKQGWMHVLVCALVSCSFAASMTSGAATSAHAAAYRVTRVMAPEKGTSSTHAKRTNLTRQFTGYVTSIDAKSVTVEKRGKKPETRVFVKHDEMKTEGDIAKETRVTVYYREADGKAIAQRMIAKPASSKSSKSPKSQG